MINRNSKIEFSGLDWINHIPNQWTLIRLNYILTESKLTSTTGSETLLAVSQYTDVTISERNITDGIYATNKFVGYKLVSRNDLVINIMLAWNGSLGVSKHNGIVSPSYCVYCFDEESYPQYYHYLLKTPMMLSQFMKYSSGIVMSRLRLYPDDLHNILVPKPPLSDQVIIALYLDNFNMELDYLSELRKNQIALLEEYKRALIQQAVTRGLDPDVPLKPSGVEWLGDIPEHWEAVRLKYCLDKVYSGGTPDSGNDLYYCDPNKGIPWLMISDITDSEYVRSSQKAITEQGRMSKSLDILPSGTLLYSMYASLGSVALLEIDACVNQAILGLSFRTEKVLSKFALYFLQSIQEVLPLFSNSSTQANLNAEIVLSLPILIPPLTEQAAIVARLDRLTSDIDAAIAHTRREIELLEEYRTRLIVDVVTGKLDVREAAANLPDVNLDDIQPLAEGSEPDD